MTGSLPVLLAEPPVGQPLLMLLVLTLVMVTREMRLVRIRTALNRALHELRRPLQVLALDSPGPVVHQAVRAVGELDRTLNGGDRPVAPPEPVACRPLLDACIRRWRSRARLSGAELKLCWNGPDAVVSGDGPALFAAVENLVLNAIEHGGPDIRIEGRKLGRWVRIDVRDSGRDSRTIEHRISPAEMIASQRSAASRGHGLEIVRETVERHGGRLRIRIDHAGSRVSLSLPCRAGSRPDGTVRVNW